MSWSYLKESSQIPEPSAKSRKISPKVRKNTTKFKAKKRKYGKKKRKKALSTSKWIKNLVKRQKKF